MSALPGAALFGRVPRGKILPDSNSKAPQRKNGEKADAPGRSGWACTQPFVFNDLGAFLLECLFRVKAVFASGQKCEAEFSLRLGAAAMPTPFSFARNITYRR